MRFKFEKCLKADYISFKTKTKIKFLFFPKIIRNEFRWLEFAKIEYKYTESYEYESGIGAIPVQSWVSSRWMPYDPVKDCNVFKTEGCVHVDGILCDIENCSLRNGVAKSPK